MPPNRWLLALSIIAGGGLLIGLLEPDAAQVLRSRGSRPGLAMMAAVNILVPALVLAVVLWCPHPRCATLGAMVGYAALVCGHMLRQNPTFWTWSSAGAAGNPVHPVVVVGCVVLTLLSIGAMVGVRPWRRVGVRRPPGACTACGYPCPGLTRCPECGGEL